MKEKFTPAGPNELANSENANGVVAGFWRGLWHGMIAPVAFVVSLFNENVGLYEAHNNGKWYNFGFIFGLMMAFGSSRGGAMRTYPQKPKDQPGQ